MAEPFVPPPREGVAASRVGVGDGRFADVLAFLVARFPAVADWPERLARGAVLDDQGRPLAAASPCRLGQQLWYWRDPPPEPRVPFEMPVLFQDAHLVVVDKPHFLAAIPGGRHLRETALVRLRQLTGLSTLVPMHRLDRETAGVLAFIVQPGERDAYQGLLRGRDVEKVYEAVAPWRAELETPRSVRHRIEKPRDAQFMQVRVEPGEPNAETGVEMIARLEGGLAHYRLRPVTGRTHQLRVQMDALGAPIVGDRIYPRLHPEPAPGVAPDWTSPLQLLAREFAFTDPVTGELRRFASARTLALAGR